MKRHIPSIQPWPGILVVLALVASPVAAQQPQQRHTQPHPAGTCPMHSGAAMDNGNGIAAAPMQPMMMSGPAMMVSQRTELGLSSTQVQRLDSLAAMQQRSMQRLMPQMMRGMADLMEATSGDIDVTAARAAHDRVAKIHSDMLVSRLEAMKAARAVLTPAQRTRWQAMAAQHGGMMGMMMGGMMMHHAGSCPGGGH